MYLALALLVEAGGGDAGKALAAADAELAALAPDAKSKVCWSPICKALGLHARSLYPRPTRCAQAGSPGPGPARALQGALVPRSGTEELHGLLLVNQGCRYCQPS